MNKIQETYLRLLRKAILLGKREEVRGKNILEELPADVVDAVVQLAQRQGTGPLVFDQLLRDGATGDRRQAMEMLMKQHCMQNMMLQEQMKAVQAKTLSALSEGGVDAVVFKGFALAQHYPQPHLRQWGDIDIYVGDKGYHQTAEILRQTWPGQPCFETEEDYFKHWNIIANGISIEAHRVTIAMTHPRDKRLWKRLEREGMGIGDRRQEIGPEEKFNILLVFIHSWHHYVDSRSANMKQVCDVALCIQAIGDRRQATGDRFIRRNLRKLRLTQVWEAYAWIMVEKLGLEPEMCPGYRASGRRGEMARRRGEKLLQRILNPVKVYRKPATEVNQNKLVRRLNALHAKIQDSFSLWEISPVYAVHDLMGKILDGISRMVKGELNRRWE